MDQPKTASQLCLENSLIIQTILKNVFYHPMKLLEMRKINKRFNAECLHRIRQFQRKMELGYCEDDCILVNNQAVGIESLDRYFRFLIEVAGVRVEEIRTDHVWMLEEKESIHSNIMDILLKNQHLKVLNGMESVCKDGCSDCERIVLGCSEYGPLQYQILIDTFGSQNNIRHFEKLIISELLIWKVAKLCVQEATNKAECLQALESIVTPRISCDHLQFEFTEDPRLLEMTDDYATCHQAFPLEVLITMVIVWKAKSVGIQIDSYVEQDTCSSHWTEKNFFTEFRFDNPHENTLKTTGVQFEFVNIHLEKASYSRDGIFEGGHNLQIETMNLLANVKRLFPAKQYFVNQYRSWAGMRPHPPLLNQQMLENILKVVWMNDHPKSKVTIRYLFKITESSESFEIPEQLQFGNKQFKCVLLQKTLKDWFDKRNYEEPFHTFDHIERCGKVFEISNDVSRSVLHLEVYVEKADLEKFPEKVQCFANISCSL